MYHRAELPCQSGWIQDAATFGRAEAPELPQCLFQAQVASNLGHPALLSCAAIAMRVFLTNTDLESDAGKHLLELTVRIATDGRLDLQEIRELRKWLRENQANERISAIGYLHDIMDRITTDAVVDR